MPPARAAAGARRAAAHRPELLVFTPLPPMPTGIGDYAFELLPDLARHYRCTVVAEDLPPRLHVPDGIALMRLSDHARTDDPAPDAVRLYMLGNNPDHLYMLPELARRPGVIVLHDPGLHHLLDCATASLGNVAGYQAALEAEYGAPGRVLAEQWRAHELRDRQMLYHMPMLRQVLGPARHIIVHSRYAAWKVRAQAPQVPLTIAPHPYHPPAARVSRSTLRGRLGIAADEIVFLSLGFVSHIKRIDIALRALARVAARLPRFRYVIAGATRPDELDVDRLARTLGLSAQVLTTGYVAEEDFFGMIDMADIVINLRHPVGGETSGTLIRALGSGACVVVTDDGPFAEIPPGAAVRVAWGPQVESALGDALLRLAISPATRSALGAAAAAVIARDHAPSRSLAAYRAAIDAAARVDDRPWTCTATFSFAPPQRAPPCRAPLWQLLGAVPVLSPAGSVLLLGRAGDLTALRQLGHAPRCAGPAWEPGAESPRGLDLAVICLGPGHRLLVQDRLLEALNRMLRFGAMLVLSLEQIGPHDHWLAARATGTAALQAAGFRIEQAAAAAAPRLDHPAAPAPDGMVWRVTKVSEFFARAVA